MAKTKKVKQPDFPATLFVIGDVEFDGSMYFVARSEDQINESLDTNKRNKVGIYELVGYEYRTKKAVVDIEEA